MGRYALLETAENPAGFARSSHLVCEIVEYCEDTEKFSVQAYTQSGDKEGKPSEESRDDIWLFPPVGFLMPAKTCKKGTTSEKKLANLPVQWFKVQQYNLPTSNVSLVHEKNDPSKITNTKDASKKKSRGEEKKNSQEEGLRTLMTFMYCCVCLLVLAFATLCFVWLLCLCVCWSVLLLLLLF